MASMPLSVAGYRLAGVYQETVDRIRACAPDGLQEVWGVCHFKGFPDYRLNLDRYRVVSAAPLATRVAVFMEWSKVFRHPDEYAGDDFAAFEDAFGYLGVNDNWNQPWNVRSDTDLDDGYVEVFLTCGIRLMVQRLCRAHPKLHLP